MDDILIRQYQTADEEEVLDICYKTGYMGEDLTNRNLFNDRKLFGYLFCLYYVWYEKPHCFVAIDKTTGKVVGYVLGTDDSKKQELQFAVRMVGRIVLRFMLYTSWRYTESFRSGLFLLRNIGRSRTPNKLYEEYPAHLHINVHPDYQDMGIGSKLIGKFERHLAARKVPGIHLRTTNKNQKAIPFYRKKGYLLLREEKVWLWVTLGENRALLLAKKLNGRH